MFIKFYTGGGWTGTISLSDNQVVGKDPITIRNTLLTAAAFWNNLW